MTPDNVQVAVPEEPRASEPVEPEERTTALVRWEDRPQGWTLVPLRVRVQGGEPVVRVCYTRDPEWAPADLLFEMAEKMNAGIASAVPA